MSEHDDAQHGVVDALVGAVVRPMPTLAGVADAAFLTPSLVAVLAAGLSWGAFCGALYAAGHQPSFVGLPVDASAWYLYQAVFIAPLLLVGWALLATVSHAVARALGGVGTLPGTAAATGLGYGLPILLVFVMPDVLMYAAGGFAELAFLVRLSMPLCALWVLVMSAAAARATHEISWGRAAIAALAGVVVQGAVVGLLAR